MDGRHSSNITDNHPHPSRLLPFKAGEPAYRWITHHPWKWAVPIWCVCYNDWTLFFHFLFAPPYFILFKKYLPALSLSCSTWDLVDQGWNLGLLHWEHGVLATGPPGKASLFHFFNCFSSDLLSVLLWALVYMISSYSSFRTRAGFQSIS